MQVIWRRESTSERIVVSGATTELLLSNHFSRQVRHNRDFVASYLLCELKAAPPTDRPRILRSRLSRRISPAPYCGYDVGLAWPVQRAAHSGPSIGCGTSIRLFAYSGARGTSLPTGAPTISLIFADRASIANGFVMICMWGSRCP